MANDKLFKLLDAGYTKEEIAEILGTGSDEGEEEPDTGVESSQGDQEHESKITPEDNNKTIADLTATIKELKKTVKAMQEANATGAKTDKPRVEDKIQEAIKSFTDSL